VIIKNPIIEIFYPLLCMILQVAGNQIESYMSSSLRCWMKQDYIYASSSTSKGGRAEEIG